jgi:hypothetical protein
MASHQHPQPARRYTVPYTFDRPPDTCCWLWLPAARYLTPTALLTAVPHVLLLAAFHGPSGTSGAGRVDQERLHTCGGLPKVQPCMCGRFGTKVPSRCRAADFYNEANIGR